MVTNDEGRAGAFSVRCSPLVVSDTHVLTRSQHRAIFGVATPKPYQRVYHNRDCHILRFDTRYARVYNSKRRQTKASIVQQRITTYSQLWQDMAERLRRPGAVIGLLLVLLLGLIEPLTCVVHCSLLNMLATSQSAVVQHHHGGAVAPSARGVATSAAQGCAHVHSGVPSLPGSDVVPQPFHEMLLLPITMLVFVSLAVRRQHRASGPPAQPHAAPLGHPPKLSLAA